MIIMNLKLNNILSFYDFNINFSYPNKLRNTLIENENLEHIPSFRYKKLNIFIGANASGKTSLMTCLWRILVFLNRHEKNYIENIVNFKYKNSYIEIDLVDDDIFNSSLHRFKIKTDNNEDNVKIQISHNKIDLLDSSSYENKIKQLNALEDNYKDYLEVLNEANILLGWRVILPATEAGFEDIRFVNYETLDEEEDYLYILNNVLMTLDPSIIKITKSNDVDNAFVIEHEGTRKIIVQEGYKLSDIPFLSSGTKYGFNIANMIFSIKHHKNEIYILDEQFSYINSDIEEAIISTMVSLLGPNEQLFITTHNSNVLGLGYPFHSFNFIKKEYKDEKHVISVDCASSIENRNNVSPKTILDNDVFSTAPNVNKIFELGE